MLNNTIEIISTLRLSIENTISVNLDKFNSAFVTFRRARKRKVATQYRRFKFYHTRKNILKES